MSRLIREKYLMQARVASKEAKDLEDVEKMHKDL